MICMGWHAADVVWDSPGGSCETYIGLASHAMCTRMNDTKYEYYYVNIARMIVTLYILLYTHFIAVRFK